MTRVKKKGEVPLGGAGAGSRVEIRRPVFLFQMNFLVYFCQSFLEDRKFFELRVEGENALRFETRLLDQFYVTQVLHRAVGDAGLAGAEELSRAADFEVIFGEFEAVFGIDQGVESLGSIFRI